MDLLLLAQLSQRGYWEANPVALSPWVCSADGAPSPTVELWHDMLINRFRCDGASVRAGWMGVSVGWAGVSKSLVWHGTPTNEYWRDMLKDKFNCDEASVMRFMNFSQLILTLGWCLTLGLQGGWGTGGWVLL